MPRVLMLARHFPPIGGAGVHRTVGSVRHLPAHGYEPVVITGPAPLDEQQNRWEPRDPGLLGNLPADAEIHRIPGPEPAGRQTRLRKILDMPAPWVGHWLAESVELGIAVGREADVVLASCLPYDTAYAGARVAAGLGRPWVADLEDPWALDEMRIPLSAPHRTLDLRRMRRALATASAIVMAAPEAAERVRREMPELASRIVVEGIPIGYEPTDFPADPVAGDPVTYRIVHTGSMHTDLGQHLRSSYRHRVLGGVVPGLDVLTRSHVFLIEAIAALTAAAPTLAGRIELHLAGDLTPADRAVADGHGFVRTHGLLSHRESVALMRSADLLFLPMHDLPQGVRAGLIPYKTFEYLAARRPILAAVPDGDVRDMLEPLPHTSVVRPADVAAMVDVLRRRIATGREPDTAPPAEYERRHCVGRIAGVLDSVVGAVRPPVTLAA